jgi:hypothetical protein
MSLGLSAGGVLRGDYNPTEQMESLQESYFQAVVTAAGCIIFDSKRDDGIDALIKHRSKEHTKGQDQFLQIQLKSKGALPNPSAGKVSAQFSRQRFELFAEVETSVNKIVVIMHLPTDISEWISVDHDYLSLRHCSYWVNIRGQSPGDAKRPYVYAPTSQIFDDIALCEIMSRIGTGGRP